MRFALACIAFLVSAVLYAWVAAIYFYPVFIVGWPEGLHIPPWDQLAAAAVIAIVATGLLAAGLSLVNSRPEPPA